MTTRRRRAGASAAAVAVALAGWLWMRGGGDATVRRPPASAVDDDRDVAPPTADVAPAPPAAASDPDAAADPPRRRAIIGIDLAHEAANSYRQRARFPRWAHPLADGERDPIVRDREVSPVVQGGPHGADPSLVVYPASASFEAPEPAVLFAYLAVRGHPVRATEVTATLMTEDLQPLGDVVYRDDGTGGDATAGDDVWTAVVSLPPEETPRLSRSVLAQVHAAGPGSVERQAATSFQYANPHAQLTGRWRDAVVDGSLVVSAEITVREAGRFHLEASLYSADAATPVAWAQAAAVLQPGTHWLDLQYYGLALRERGVDGPYLVHYAALSTTTEMPNAKNRLAVDVHRTGAYPAARFTDEAFRDPALLEAADRLEGTPMAAGLQAGR